jgi:hypothetical protein
MAVQRNQFTLCAQSSLVSREDLVRRLAPPSRTTSGFDTLHRGPAVQCSTTDGADCGDGPVGSGVRIPLHPGLRADLGGLRRRLMELREMKSQR